MANLVGCYRTHVTTAKLLILIAVFFFTSVISVVTGSTSLITVPVMITLGIEAQTAVATNMLALTFMSVGGSLPHLAAFISHAKSGCRYRFVWRSAERELCFFNGPHAAVSVAEAAGR